MSKTFLDDALVLMLSGIIVKIIGALYKIPLTNLLGASGIALFSIAYNIYAFLFVISTSGIPIAISKLVSENIRNSGNISKIFKVSLRFFTLLAFILCILLFVMAKNLAILSGNEESYFSIIAIAPAIFFTIISSVYRGYFIGIRNMRPSADSQVIEASVKLVLGYFSALYAYTKGYPIYICCAISISAVSVGTFFSLLYLVFYPKKLGKASSSKFIKKVLSLVFPVAMTSSILSISSLIDTMQIISRLQASKLTASYASELFGAYNMALTLTNMPQVLISSISISIIPLISSRIEENINTRNAMYISLIIAIPAAFGLSVLSEEILSFLYYKRPEDAILASPILAMLSFSIPFVATVTISSAILQAQGKANVSFFNILIGAAVKVILTYFLTANENFRIYGAVISTISCYFIISILNVLCLKTLNKGKFIIFIIKNVICSYIMYISVGFFTEKTGFILAILLGIVVYLILGIISKIIRKEEILLLPFGGKVVKILGL